MAKGKEVGAMVAAFVFVIVGITLIVGLANSQTDATELKSVVNESVSLVNNSGVSLANSQVETLSRVGNASTTLVEDTDYTVNLAKGEVTLNTGNASVADRAYDVSYTYRNVGDSTSRVLVNLVVMFFAIAILLFLIGMLSPTFRDMLGISK